jgi:hypothetical protein
MVKWIWKIYTKKENLWLRPLQAKYMRDGDFFKSRGHKGLNSGRVCTRLNTCSSGGNS